VITEEYYTHRMRTLPTQDDLERCNCKDAGTFMHTQCGWDKEFDLPVFVVGRDPAQREHFRNHLWKDYLL
jgi:hypothetical protein